MIVHTPLLAALRLDNEDGTKDDVLDGDEEDDEELKEEKEEDEEIE